MTAAQVDGGNVLTIALSVCLWQNNLQRCGRIFVTFWHQLDCVPMYDRKTWLFSAFGRTGPGYLYGPRYSVTKRFLNRLH